MLTQRELPREEWARLEGLDLGQVREQLPLDTRILVVEDEGVIVGAWALMSFVHAEGIWIAPAYRKRGSVLLRLLRLLRSCGAAMGVSTVWTGALTPDIGNLIVRLGGQQLPGDHFILPVETLPCL